MSCNKSGYGHSRGLGNASVSGGELELILQFLTRVNFYQGSCCVAGKCALTKYIIISQVSQQKQYIYL